MIRIKIVGVSVISVVVIILGSSSNVVGYQTVQSPNQNTINKEIIQRELLFQTIIDMANNKEVQQITLKSRINKQDLLYSDERFPLLKNPIVTKYQIKRLYFFGLLFSRINSQSRMNSVFDQYHFSNQEIHTEITAVIEKDDILDKQVTHLLSSKCDCDTEQTSSWEFPILCRILYILGSIGFQWGFYGGFYLLGWFASFFPGDLIERLIILPRALVGMLVFSISITLAMLFDCYWINE
jgi:hypothetical protein